MAKLALALLAGLLALLPAVAAVDPTSTTIEKQKVFSSEPFPATTAARPPLPTFRTLATATSVSCAQQSNGLGMRLTLKHAEIPDVNGTMMLWFWRNLATRSAVSPADNQTYPMFMLYHPRDHIRAKTSRNPMAAGGTAEFLEFPLTGCSSADGRTWNCPTAPAANPGFTQASPYETWATTDQVNATTSVRALRSSTTIGSVSFGTLGCRNPNNGPPCAWIILTTHSWTTRRWVVPGTTPPQRKFALRVTTNVRVGINMARYDTDITNGWANGLNPTTKCYRMATHFVEEVGTLLDWLPRAYAERSLY